MDEVNSKNILIVVNILVKPSSLVSGKVSDLKDTFKNNIKQTVQLIPCISELKLLKTKCKLKWNTPDDTDICWHYVCICLEVLLTLKENLQKNEDELLSAPQQKSLKSIFEFIVSMGILPYLLTGVGLGIDHRCPNAALFKDLIITSVTDVEKYCKLCTVIRGILYMIEEKLIGSLFLTNHMEDLFAALCQLTIPRFKQPTQDLVAEREYFQTKFTHVISTSYQPLVINALMILQGNKESPRWLRLGVSKLLTERLMGKSGVISTIRAMQHTVDYENPNVVTRLESVARLIVTPHTKDSKMYYTTISPQVLRLIQSDDVNLMRVGVLCCRVMYEINHEAFEEHISSVMMAPLYNYSCNYSEDQITQCLQCLHKCFAIPNSEMWSVPVEGLLPLSKIIYVIYCKICDSALVIKKPIEELLWVVLSKNNELLSNIFKCLLLNEPFSEIKELPDGINITFGDEGGVKITRQSDNVDKIEYSNCILKLLEEKDSSGKISKNLFLTLLNYCSTLSDEICEVKLYVMELLADLAETERVQKNIIDDSESIIKFIETLICNKLKSSEGDTELLSIALVLLLTIMNNMSPGKDSQWDKFKNLSILLPKLSLHSKSIELKMLCDEVYNIIFTQGGIIDNSSNKKETLSNYSEVSNSTTTKSSCDIALEEACDPLIPVRGHAIMELTKLISAGDSEAKAKKQKILCIFQENLKNEDSYLYLTAIEGMASLAAEFPDTVLVTLTEEYSRTETTVRLKVGESLMRVIRRLGDMTPVYKNELLNSFLSGVRDTDNLVRASSLSNIGELCQLLGFRIGPIACEILNCVECVVATDPTPEPRRAAVMLLTLLLRGLHEDALNVLEPVLLPLYRNLKKIYQLDKDDVVRLHAQLAIEELNKATLSFIFPSIALSKQIFVLDSPL